MNFFQETTKYTGNVRNGIYLLDNSKTKMYAYIKAGSDSVFTFKKPIRIDTRGRKFELVDNTFNYNVPQEVTSNPRWEVVGSKGDVYIVEKTQQGITCSCSGFKFRGKCKHLDKYK
jgi:hypothetical protein